MACKFDGTHGDVLNTGYLSTSAGPWTIMMWARLSSTALTNRYLFQLASGGATNQLAIIFGFTANKYEIFRNNGTGSDPRTGSDITPGDTGWHHIAYRKSASGASAYDKFLDGVKTSINASITFSLPTIDHSYIGAAVTDANGMDSSVYRVFVLDDALSDGDIASEAAGTYLGPSFSAGDGYWPFTTFAGTDLSGNGHDFDNHGAGTTVTNPGVFPTGFLINPGMQGGMRPLLLGGVNG